MRDRERIRGSEAERARERWTRHVTKLTALRECVRCSKHYREIDNLGTWKCRYHPGLLQSAHYHVGGIDAGHWTCCALSARVTRPADGYMYTSGELFFNNPSRGCARCDHVSTHTRQHEPTRRLNRSTMHALFGEYAPDAPGRHIDERTGDVIVVRTDDDDDDDDYRAVKQ